MVWWYVPVIPSLQEVEIEIRKTVVLGQAEQKQYARPHFPRKKNWTCACHPSYYRKLKIGCS
jgi:hypothetical protein